MSYSNPILNRQVAILVGVSSLAAVVAALALSAVVLQNPGSVSNVEGVGIEVYEDFEGLSMVSTIDWGTVEAGAKKNVTVYVLNKGTADVGLSMNLTNWSPVIASDYVTLVWDYKNQKISPNQPQRATLMLEVSSEIQGVTSFSFDIVVTSIEYP